MTVPGLLMIVGALALITGCDRQEAERGVSSSTVPEHVTVAPPVIPPIPKARGPRVVFLGDSLTAGYGLERDEAFPSLVGKALEEKGLAAEIVNAGVSGDTSAGGLRRIDWLLRQKPDIVVVGLGGNDGLRGMDPSGSESNLRSIVLKSREAGADVLLLGMMIPTNYGQTYTTQFREIYPRLAKELNVPLVPFLLEAVGGVLRLNQPDGIHPTAEGHRLVALTVLPYLQPLVTANAETPPSK